MIHTVFIVEAEPGLVHVTTEAMHDLLTAAGWRRRETTRHGELRSDQFTLEVHHARPPHSNTMAGR